MCTVAYRPTGQQSVVDSAVRQTEVDQTGASVEVRWVWGEGVEPGGGSVA